MGGDDRGKESRRTRSRKDNIWEMERKRAGSRSSKNVG